MVHDFERAARIDWSEEFQKRRWQAWRKARAPLAIIAVSLLVFMLLPNGFDHVPIFFGAFLAFAAATLWLALIARRHYTCPSCNEVPVLRGGGLILRPEFCPTCGVRLARGAASNKK